MTSGWFPNFSVIVPAHNAEATIERCLNSVMAQDSSGYEVLVVDDGSTDGTAERVRRFKGIALLRQDQRGACAARNTGLGASTGRYAVFLDADDEVEPDWLTALAEELDRDPAPLTVTCGVRLIEATRDSPEERRDLYPGPLGAAFSNWRALFLPGAYAVDRRVLLELGGFAEGVPYGEHSELALRLASWAEERGAGVVWIDRLLVTKHHDRTPARVADYNEARRRGAEYQLTHHAERLGRDRRLAANYHAVAGVACMRLGKPREGRRHFRRAAWLHPSPKHFMRLAVGLMPTFASRRWRRVASERA